MNIVQGDGSQENYTYVARAGNFIEKTNAAGFVESLGVIQVDFCGTVAISPSVSSSPPEMLAPISAIRSEKVCL
jgi:hypothetical protein